MRSNRISRTKPQQTAHKKSLGHTIFPSRDSLRTIRAATTGHNILRRCGMIDREVFELILDKIRQQDREALDILAGR